MTSCPVARGQCRPTPRTISVLRDQRSGRPSPISPGRTVPFFCKHFTGQGLKIESSPSALVPPSRSSALHYPHSQIGLFVKSSFKSGHLSSAPLTAPGGGPPASRDDLPQTTYFLPPRTVLSRRVFRKYVILKFVTTITSTIEKFRPFLYDHNL
ncbi:hypothetical protein J6590_032384 [Homalodisca vitripennis]|nr:hypothetical protein J6590_032384 [Homalodisca vitripennis]